MEREKNEEEKEYYLQNGPVTEVTPQIREIAEKFPADLDGFVDDFKRWRTTRIGNTRLDDKTEWERYFRKRSADQIVSQAFSNPDDHVGTIGCTDDAILFVTMARAKGFPSKYVECILKENTDGTEGHVFAKVFDGEMWVVIDPASRPFERGWNFNDYNVIAEGLDYKELGLDSIEKIKSTLEGFSNDTIGDSSDNNR